MRLYLVRHTKVNLPPGICYGKSNVPIEDISDLGKVAEQLSTLTQPLVYSSPLDRCTILAKTISPEFIADMRLEELNFGEWELKPWNEIKGLEADQWMNDFVNTPCPGGESYMDLCGRVKDFLTTLPTETKRPIIIVTHGGVMRAILAIVQKLELKNSFERTIDFGEIIAVEQPD